MNKKNVGMQLPIIFAIISAIMISIVTTIINYNAFEKGYMPTPFQAFSSLFCILFWVLISFYGGYKKEIRYLIFCSLFWGIGLFLFILGYYINSLFVFALPSVIIIVGPLYGLKYFLKQPSNLLLACLSVFIAYVLMLIGFFIGKNCLVRNNK